MAEEVMHEGSVKIMHDEKGKEIRVWSCIGLYKDVLDPKGNYGHGIYRSGGYEDIYGYNHYWDSMEYISNKEASKITKLEADIQETLKRYPNLQKYYK